MNDHQHKSKLRLGWIFVSVIVVLLSFGSAHLYDRLSARPTIVIENNGAAHLGVIPLKNKTVRHMTLQALAHVQSSTVSLAVARSARFSKVADLLDAMNRAGITSVVLRTEASSERK